MGCARPFGSWFAVLLLTGAALALTPAPASAAGKPAGADCGRDRDCQSGECGGIPRRCYAAKGSLEPGKQCRRDLECKSGQCSGVGDHRTCTALTGHLEPGARCKRDEECKSGQCRGLGADRKCEKLGGALQAGAACKRDAECHSGRCTLFKCEALAGTLPPGAKCKRDKECQSGECHGKGCTAMTGTLLTGEPCRIDKECKVGKCDHIVDLDSDYCDFAGSACRAGQPKPAFPVRTSTSKSGVHVKWLGTAGWEISVDEMRILVDPFIARPWRHFQRGRAIKWSAIANALSRRQLIEGDPTLPQHMRAYEGITRADWIFVTHGHVDHAAEVGPILLHLAERAHGRHEKLKVGVIGDRNLGWLLDAYELKFGLGKRLGAQITRHVAPYDLGENAWTKVPPENPATRVKKFDLGSGVTATFYPAHHSAGAAATAGWDTRTGPPPPLPISLASYKVHGVHDFLIEARGKRILFLGSTNIHLGKPHLDPLPKGPVDLVLMALPSWDTGNADRQLAAMKALQPKVIIPHHYDDYFWDWREGCFISEYANLPRFLREAPELLRKQGLATKIRQLDFGGTYSLDDQRLW